MIESKDVDEKEYLSSPYLEHLFLDFQQMKEFIRNPLIFSRGEGVWIWDVKGEKYMDGISGVWVVNVGHGNKRVINAIKEQLDKICFTSPIYSTNPRAVELANLLSEITPGNLKTIKLFSGGSEAIEAAMKLARQYHKQTGNPNKYKIISRYLSFHGMTAGALSATGIAKWKWKFEPLTVGSIHVPPCYCFRCPYKLKYPKCDILCARIVRDIIDYEGAETVAAFIAEPIVLSTGNLTPPPEYFPILREICNETDTLLIYDEIITGFGRTGQMWGAQTFNAIPDIMCMGKGMSSGYAPLAAIAFRDDIAEAFYGEKEEEVEFHHGHTYASNPVSCAAGIAATKEIIERDLPRRAREMGSYLWKRLEELNELGIVGEIRGKGLMIGIEFVKDNKTLEPFPREVRFGEQVGKTCINKFKLLVRCAGPQTPDWIAVAPPLVITEEEIDIMVERLNKGIKEVLKNVENS